MNIQLGVIYTDMANFCRLGQITCWYLCTYMYEILTCVVIFIHKDFPLVSMIKNFYA